MSTANTDVQQDKVKPRWRGHSHQYAALAMVLYGILIVTQAPTTFSAIAAAVYSASVVALFGISALYHRPMWRPRPRRILRRLDHSAIFILVAGTYTPIVLLVFPQEIGTQFISIVWGGAFIGIAQSIFWPSAPKTLVALLCIALGWIIVFKWEMLKNELSIAQLSLIAVGGVLYTIGAIIYALKRPNPWPKHFGYHEVFHALTILATVCHATVVTQIVMNSAR